MDLRTYLSQAPRGAGAAIARAVGVHPVMVSQWAAGAKPVPDERAPALEAATAFQVTCEESCPGARWVRVPAEGWPNGKPLQDNSPAIERPAPVIETPRTAGEHAAARCDTPWRRDEVDRRRADKGPPPNARIVRDTDKPQG